jgi:hypothetical protein
MALLDLTPAIIVSGRLENGASILVQPYVKGRNPSWNVDPAMAPGTDHLRAAIQFPSNLCIPSAIFGSGSHYFGTSHQGLRAAGTPDNLL